LLNPVSFCSILKTEDSFPRAEIHSLTGVIIRLRSDLLAAGDNEIVKSRSSLNL